MKNENSFEDGVIENTFYESFESRKAKKVLGMITDIEKISQSKNFSLKARFQELIEKIGINANAAELQQLINDEDFNSPSEKEIYQDLQTNLQKLQLELEQLPYSNHSLINEINTSLEKLADFLSKEAKLSEPHHVDFFRSAGSPNTSVEDLSEKLSGFSTGPSK